jgi:hypothetical protein
MPGQRQMAGRGGADQTMADNRDMHRRFSPLRPDPSAARGDENP